MCGILFTNKEIVNLVKTIKFLKNRGPDHTEHKIINNYNFVHVLLSMTGNNYTIQPFYYENHDIVVIFNGEIYNYLDFGKYNSDGECIIDVYLKYGDSFIEKFDGEFVILLCDFKKDLIYYSTDIFSVKPLWESINGTFIGISSYESCLLELGFQDVKQLPPNKTIKRKLSNLELIEERRVITFDLNQHKKTFNDWNLAFEEAILKRVRKIKHNIFIGLSSGYDSGAIACVLHKNGIKFRSYSIEGSENPEIIKERGKILENVEKITPSNEEFINQKYFLKKNSEPYQLYIDNNYEKILIRSEKKLEALIKEEKLIGDTDKVKKNIISYNKKILKNKIQSYKNTIKQSHKKKIYEDNGAIGLGYICSKARPRNELIYLTGSGADEIISDYGWNGVKHYRHSTIGGWFPEDLKTVFPWKNFFMNTQRAYLMKEEYVAGTYGIEGRYPFLDKTLVQEFLWLDKNLKNQSYKAPIENYLIINNFPFDKNKKMGFNCGFSNANNDNIIKKIATRTQIGETNDETLKVKKKNKKKFILSSNLFSLLI